MSSLSHICRLSLLVLFSTIFSIKLQAKSYMGKTEKWQEGWSKSEQPKQIETEATYFRSTQKNTPTQITYTKNLYPAGDLPGTLSLANRVAIGIHGEFIMNIESGTIKIAPKKEESEEKFQTVIGLATTKQKAGAKCVVNIKAGASLLIAGVNKAILGAHSAGDGDGHAQVNVNGTFICNAPKLVLGSNIGSKSNSGRIILKQAGMLNIGENTILEFQSSTNSPEFPSYISITPSSKAYFRHEGRGKSYYEGLASSGYLRINGHKVSSFSEAFNYDEKTSKVFAKKAITALATADRFRINSDGKAHGNVCRNDKITTPFPATKAVVLIEPKLSSSFELDATGTFTYQRKPGLLVGNDYFTYRLKSKSGLSEAVAVEIEGLPEMTGHWTFNDKSSTSALASAEKGKSLSLVIANGIKNAVSGIGGSDTGAISLDLEEHLEVPHGLKDHSSFTIVMDVSPRDLSDYSVLLEMDDERDGDVFIKKTGVIGFNHDYSGKLEEKNWYRIYYVFANAKLQVWVFNADGTLNGAKNAPTVTIDKSNGIPHGANRIFIGKDGPEGNPNEEKEIHVSQLAVYNWALAPNEIMKQTTPGSHLRNIAKIMTPPSKVKLVQKGNSLEWTVAKINSVNKFVVSDAKTGEVLETIIASGEQTYKATLPPAVRGKLMVVEHTGSMRAILPE